MPIEIVNKYANPRTKQNLCSEFSISLSTVRRTLEAIGADCQPRFYSGAVLEDFALARDLFRQGWTHEQVHCYFQHRQTTKIITNISTE